MVAPTFISSTNTTVATGSNAKTTASIAVQSGDVLVAFGLMANGSPTSVPLVIATVTGSTSAWTLQQDNVANTVNNPYARAWTATATATGNITVSITQGASQTVAMCLIIKVWRNSGGIGVTNRNDNGIVTPSTPTISITTTGANSALDFASIDWTGVTGTVTFTASNGTPVVDLSDQTDSTDYCVYSDHVVDVGVIGSKTMGMSAPTGQRFICDVIEVLGAVAIVSDGTPMMGQIWI